MKKEIINNSNSKIIRVKKDEVLTIIEYFDDELLDTSTHREIILEENSTLEYLKLSNIKQSTNLEISYDIKCGSNSKCTLHFFELGEGESTNRLQSDLLSENINLNINALVRLQNSARVFNSMNIVHKHLRTFSDIKIRHILDDKSRAQFEAKTIIENVALYSKAFQDSKTILLSDDAQIKVRPHLEIRTDELEASHGAVTGGLDDDAIYYLQSRGISKKDARDILIDAVAIEAMDNIESDDIRAWLEASIKEI